MQELPKSTFLILIINYYKIATTEVCQPKLQRDTKLVSTLVTMVVTNGNYGKHCYLMLPSVTNVNRACPQTKPTVCSFGTHW
jgi:hypothetical protein